MSHLHAIACLVLLGGCPNTPERSEVATTDRDDEVEGTGFDVETAPTAELPDAEVVEDEVVEDETGPDDFADGDASDETGPDIDVAGACSSDEDPLCDDDNPCTADTCRANGTCAHTPNLALCDDGDPCTTFDRCSGGTCVGVGLDCDDGNPCTADDCADDDCQHTPVEGACDDGDVCTERDRCLDGACVGAEVACPGAGPCGDASCEPRVGCVIVPRDEGAACDDDNACTLETTCRAGACRGALVACSDGDPCTDDYCDPTAGCVYRDNAAPCDDGDACTTGDRCADGACAGVAAGTCCPPGDADCCALDSDCDDGVACTLDRCDGRCRHEPWAPLPAEGQVVADFEGALDGWTFASDNDLVGWRASDAWSASGGHSLYCGDAAGAGYDHGATRATATTTVLVPPVDPVLHVVTRRDVSEAGSCVYDALSVVVEDRVVAVVCGSGEGEATIALTGYEGREVALAFVFDTIDGRDNVGAGVWIDRVRLTAGACTAVVRER